MVARASCNADIIKFLRHDTINENISLSLNNAKLMNTIIASSLRIQQKFVEIFALKYMDHGLYIFRKRRYRYANVITSIQAIPERDLSWPRAEEVKFMSSNDFKTFKRCLRRRISRDGLRSRLAPLFCSDSNSLILI